MPAIAELLGISVEALIALSALVAWIAAYGMFKVWGATFGAAFVYLGDKLRFDHHYLGVHIHLDFGSPFRYVNNAVVDELQAVIAGSQIEIGWSIRTIHLIWQAQAEAVDWLARETSQTFDALIHLHIPKAAKAAAAAALPYTLLRKWIDQEVAKLRPEVVKITKVIEHNLPAKTITIVRHAVSDVSHLPGWILHLPHWLHGIDELETRLEKRVRHAETIFGATAFAAALANVWGIPFRCARSGGPMGRLARTLCGLSGEALNDLFGLLIDVLIVEDICQVIVLLEDALSLVQGPLNTFVDVVDGALCHGDFGAAPDDPAVSLSLPPVSGLTLSLA